MPLRPCLACGEPVADSYCDECKPPGSPKASRRQRGYTYQWIVLSRRARSLQPFCSQCNTTEDLTGDHSEEAWLRQAAGKPIRLQDIDVLCRSCNSRKGRARPRGVHPL